MESFFSSAVYCLLWLSSLILFFIASFKNLTRSRLKFRICLPLSLLPNVPNPSAFRSWSADKKNLNTDLDKDEENSEENQVTKITRLPNYDILDNFLHIPRLTLSRNYNEVPEDWLILKILGLAKYRMDFDKFKGCLADFLNQSDELKFLDKDGNRLSIRQFILRYESNPAISIRYIFESDFYNFHTKHFHMNKGFCIIDQERYKKLSNKDPFDNLVISTNEEPHIEVSAEEAS
jgi:hypothetical protein